MILNGTYFNILSIMLCQFWEFAGSKCLRNIYQLKKVDCHVGVRHKLVKNSLDMGPGEDVNSYREMILADCPTDTLSVPNLMMKPLKPPFIQKTMGRLMWHQKGKKSLCSLI